MQKIIFVSFVAVLWLLTIIQTLKPRPWQCCTKPRTSSNITGTSSMDYYSSLYTGHVVNSTLSNSNILRKQQRPYLTCRAGCELVRPNNWGCFFYQVTFSLRHRPTTTEAPNIGRQVRLAQRYQKKKHRIDWYTFVRQDIGGPSSRIRILRFFSKFKKRVFTFFKMTFQKT